MAAATPGICSDIDHKLKELFDSAILGGYNPEARMQAMEAKFQEQKKLYKNKDKIAELQKKEDAIKDPIDKALFQIAYKVEFLEEDVDEFRGAHYNLRYRQLKEKCTQLQLELDKIKFREHEAVEETKQRKKMLLKKIEVIENRLLNRVQSAAGVGHDPKTCKGCQ